MCFAIALGSASHRVELISSSSVLEAGSTRGADRRVILERECCLFGKETAIHDW